MGYYICLYNSKRDSANLLRWLSDKYMDYLDEKTIPYEIVFEDVNEDSLKAFTLYVTDELGPCLLKEYRGHRGIHLNEDGRVFKTCVNVYVFKENLDDIPYMIRQSSNMEHYTVTVETIGIVTRCFKQVHAINLAKSYYHHIKESHRKNTNSDRIYNFKMGWISDENGYKHIDFKRCTFDDFDVEN